MWFGISSHIVQQTEERKHLGLNCKDINLFLASHLVMGLAPQPAIVDYFSQDKRGIFGSLWMQQHFTREKWSDIHSHLHYDPQQCIQILKINTQQLWNLDQVLVVNEMIVPFTGCWKWIQFVKGKSHNTRLKIYCLANRNFYLWIFGYIKVQSLKDQGNPKILL